jgi:hypothetical protein
VTVSIEEERNRVWAAIGNNADRITELHDTMRETIREAVHDAMPAALPTEKHLRYLDLVIEREAGRASLRKAVIEKTLAGLALAAVLGVFAISWSVFSDFIASKGGQP